MPVTCVTSARMQAYLFRFSESDANAKENSSLSATDRLNCVITVSLLLMLAAFIITMMYFWGMPIACRAPAHFKKSHRKFTNQVGVEGAVQHAPNIRI